MRKKKIRTWLLAAGSFAVLSGCPKGTPVFAAGKETERFFAERREDCRRFLAEAASAVTEPGRYEILVTGVDFSPDSLALAQLFPEIANISNTEISREKQEGKEYVTCRIGFEKLREEEFCEHQWERERLEAPACLAVGRELVFCGRCGSEEEQFLPALGHGDPGGDTVCDRCGARTKSQEKGERITVFYENAGESEPLGFFCTGETALGQEYACLEEIPAETILSSAQSIPGEPGEKLNWWLNTDFFNEISAKAACRQVFFCDEAGKRQDFRSWDGTSGVRPGITLEFAGEETFEGRLWSVGDVQVRTLGGVSYEFRCIDDDYRDESSYDRKKALFLCETVIGSDVDSGDTQRETLPFGRNNNYKTSQARKWLSDNRDPEETEIYPVLTGVNSAFFGKTENQSFGEMTERGLLKWELPYQYMEDEFFFLSVEEAILYREELWDAEDGGTAFHRGYWLRTPVYEQDEAGEFQYGKLVYAVDLEQGCLRPVQVDDGSIGLRPAFCLLQE